MIRQAEWLVAGALALLLIWAPIPFGSVTPIAEATLSIAVFLIFALSLAGAEAPGALRRSVWPIGALVGIGFWGTLQALPWPRAFARLVSPEHVRLFDSARQLLGLPSGSVPLSLSAGESLRTALAFAVAAAAFLAAAACGRDRRHRRLLAFGLVASAIFQVLYGARRWFAHSNEIWGREVPGTSERLRGTFVNPNHLAFFLGLALPAVFAWGWWSFRRAREEIQIERRVLLLAPPIIVWLLLFSGLAFTGSRAGMLASLIAVVAQGALLAAGEKKRRWIAAGALAAATGLIVVAAIGRQEGLGRLIGLSSGAGARIEAWRATLELIRRFPFAGSGLGSFREAFPLVQPASLPGTWRHAHSDLLELLATAGVIGAVLGGIALVRLVPRLLSVFHRGRRSEDRAAALAAFGALCAAGLHELVDFSLTLPANSLAAAVLFGAALSSRRSEKAHRGGRNGAAVDRRELEQMKTRRDSDRDLERLVGRCDEGADEASV